MFHECPATAHKSLSHWFPGKTASCALVVISCTALTDASADWQFQPNLRASETYSNNVRLEKVRPMHDWVTELSAGFSVDRSKGHSFTQLGYQLQGLHFSRISAMDEAYQQLQGVTHLQRSETGFYLDGLASISQQTIDANLPAVSDNIFATGNRTDQADFQIAPGVLSRIGSMALSDLKLSHAQTEYGKGRVDSFTDAINLNLSRAHPGHLDWQWSARKERVRYSNDAATDFKNTLLSVQLSVTPHTQIVVTGGYDDTSSESFSVLGRSGSSWSTGIIWTPSRRSQLLLTAGERYFGKTYQMEFSHDYHRNHWTMSYMEDVVTSANDGAALDPVNTGISGVTTFVTDIYLSKIFTASYLRKGRYGDFGIKAYQDRREFGSTLSAEEVRSASINASVRIRPKTTLHAGASLVHRDPAGLSETDKSGDFSIWLARHLDKGGSLSLKFRNLHRADAGIVSGYDASAVSLAFERQFGGRSLSGSTAADSQ